MFAIKKMKISKIIALVVCLLILSCGQNMPSDVEDAYLNPVSYTHLRAHETT